MSLKTVRYQGIVYRAHNPLWSYAPTSGEGAARHGGRFNPKGIPALYTSEDVNTAVLEASQGFACKFQPLTICAYQIDCLDVFDTTRPTTSGYALNGAWEEIANTGQRPPTWQLYDLCKTLGISAIRVRSFATGSTENNINIVFWDWADILPHKVIVIDDEGRLPKA